MDNNEVASFFADTPVNIETNRQLREPQLMAYKKVRAHFRVSGEPCYVQLPVGCGKTGLMGILIFVSLNKWGLAITGAIVGLWVVGDLTLQIIWIMRRPAPARAAAGWRSLYRTQAPPEPLYPADQNRRRSPDFSLALTPRRQADGRHWQRQRPPCSSLRRAVLRNL